MSGTSEHRDGVLEAADDRVGDDLTGVADDEQVAEALVEDDLGGQARVRAAEQRGAGALALGELVASLDVLTRMRGSPATKRALPRCISSQTLRGCGLVGHSRLLAQRADLVGDGRGRLFAASSRRRRRR